MFRHNKISSEFANRLRNLEPQQTVRVIVLLKVENFNPRCGYRQSPAERKAAIEGIRNSGKHALNYIRKILQDFGGKELNEDPGPLGHIPVEISAAGVNALAASDAVKAVMEDLPVEVGDGTSSFR
jgi:hypothetical protein